MGITKRRIEAEEADVNQELRLCAACGDRIECKWDDDIRSMRIEHGLTGPFTTVWHCGCTRIRRRRCVKCGGSAADSQIPLCNDCLDEYEESIAEEARGAHCNCCGSDIPRGEFDQFYKTGLCGWCAHMSSKIEVGDDLERDREPEWNPEQDLLEQSRRIITPEEFLSGVAHLITDPRVIRSLCDHPSDLYTLSPRDFEELVAHLLEELGYRARLDPRGADGGVDVFAERDQDTGPELVLVQCKRFSADRKVTQPIVKQLKTDVSDRQASRGLVVTTSTFTRPALDYIHEYRYRLSGADIEKLREWLEKVRRGG